MSDLIKREDAISRTFCTSVSGVPRMVVLLNDIKALPSIDSKTKVVAQVTFDEDKLREIVHEAVEQIKEEYDIVDRPKGEWIDTGKDKEHLHPLSARWYRCSVCGLETNAKTNYCFDCGADMRGEDNEDK